MRTRQAPALQRNSGEEFAPAAPSGVRFQLARCQESAPADDAMLTPGKLKPDTWGKSPASVAGRRGTPPEVARPEDLRANSLAPLTRRGRTLQQCCHSQLCCLACNGTNPSKSNGLQRPSILFRPRSTNSNEVRPSLASRASEDSLRAGRGGGRKPAEARSAKAGGAAGHRTRVRSAYLRAFIAIVRSKPRTSRNIGNDRG